MALDPARLQTSTLALRTAETAYDAALREQAAATAKLAAAPNDATATTQLKLATQKVATTRTQVETARRTLDTIRISELAALDTGDRLLGTIAGNQVIGLFPVGVEAKLEAGKRLRVRVWPDAVSTSTHDPRLTQSELDAGQRYWRAEGAAVTDADRRAAWRELAEAVGATRAAWIARTLTPTNQAALAPGVVPVFPVVAMFDEAAPFVARASVLPDRWMAVGFRDGAKVFEQVGAPIPIDLAVGLDTTPAESKALSNREGEPIQLPPRMRWMTDFAVAKQAGMALEIPLAAGIDRIDLLLVVGVKVTQSPAANAEALANLFTGHRFSRGLAFVPQDTPTNNSAAGGSGMPSRSQRIEAGYDLERRPRAFPAGVAANGTTAARAFGVAPEVFAPLPASGAVPQMPAEPEGFEPENARAMQTALWQITMGTAIEDFLGLPAARSDAVRDYFRDHVRAAGPVPAFRVGRQPYGVLPVTQIDAFVAGAAEGIDPRMLPLLKAARTWWFMLRQGEVFAGSAEEALRNLGRSTRLFAETTRQDAAAAGQNRWASLAGSLARSSRNLISDTWRTSQIKATVDGVPQPVTRPLVDPTTSATLTMLATASPTAIRSAALPTSMFGRMARQATLLEWGRLARAVCEASLDAGSITSLRRTAASTGIDAYINVVIRAFLPTVTTGTIGTIGTIGTAAVKRSPGGDRLPATTPDLPDLPEVEPPEKPPVTPVPPADAPIDAAELKRIATFVGNLSSPLATCPGAARLESFRRSLAWLAQLPSARMESALFGTLDLCNHRVDAWMTSLASRRLATLRASTPQGLVIGGWGWLQDVRPANAADPLQRAEFIHTPSLDQAAATAVLRSAAKRANAAGSSHADIDLSSRRVRLARWLLEGVRNGRSLGELLGVRFERALKGTAGEVHLGALRRQFSANGVNGVLDGLKLQQAGLPPSSDPAVLTAAKGLEDALDALTDVLTAESVYQLVKGNPGGALVNLEAIANGEAPPPLSITETPASATRLTHRIVATIPVGAKAPGWTVNGTPRSKADPLLDAWCGFVLGSAESIVLTVNGRGGVSVAVTLSALKLGAIDVVMAGREAGAELAERVAAEALRKLPTIADAVVAENRPWRDLVGVCGALARLIARAEPLRPEALELPGVFGAATDENFGDLPARVTGAQQAAAAVRTALVQRTDPAGAVRAAAAIGIRAPGALLGREPAPQELDALLSALDVRLASAAAAGTPRDKLRALFGGELPGLVAFTPRDPAVLATTAPAAAPDLFAGDPLAPSAWLDAMGRVRPGVARVAEVLQRVEIASGVSTAALKVAQAPWIDGDRWIATSFINTKSRQRPGSRLSIVIHAPGGFTATQPLGGLLLDGWSESVPMEKRDTALALRYNSPGTRAPQAILLAVSPDPSRAWTTETLVAILRDTFDLARMRMQPPTTFSRAGQLPLAWVGQRPGDAGISFTP